MKKSIILVLCLLILGCHSDKQLVGKYHFQDSNGIRGFLWISDGQAMYLDERIYDIQLYSFRYTNDSVFFFHPALTEPYMQGSWIKKGDSVALNFGGLILEMNKQPGEISIPQTSANENAVYAEFESFLKTER